MPQLVRNLPHLGFDPGDLLDPHGVDLIRTQRGGRVESNAGIVIPELKTLNIPLFYKLKSF